MYLFLLFDLLIQEYELFIPCTFLIAIVFDKNNLFYYVMIGLFFDLIISNSFPLNITLLGLIYFINKFINNKYLIYIIDYIVFFSSYYLLYKYTLNLELVANFLINLIIFYIGNNLYQKFINING